MKTYSENRPINYIAGEYTLPEINIGSLTLRNRQISVLSSRPFPKDKLIVGIMGSAGKEIDKLGNEFDPSTEEKQLGELMGKIVADRNCIVSNGAGYGLPYFPIRGAHNAGGYTMGISPFKDRESHEPKSPIKHQDLIFYAGINYTEHPRFDFIFRDAINTLYPDIVISIGGRWGTLDEDAQVIEQGGIFVPIRGSGGTTDAIIDVIENKKITKDNGARIIIADKSPEMLESALEEAISEASLRWVQEGRTENRFSEVIGELESVMRES